jgi:hypothetical protein
MGLYRDKLERKQILLGRLMDVGTELFAMAATCSYAHSLVKRGQDNNVETLADLFCRDATRRIEIHFKDLATNDDALISKVGKAVLNGDMRWMEDGVQWIGTNA